MDVHQGLNNLWFPREGMSMVKSTGGGLLWGIIGAAYCEVAAAGLNQNGLPFGSASPERLTSTMNRGTNQPHSESGFYRKQMTSRVASGSLYC